MKINYQFKNESILENALMHSSLGNSNNNQRLEFLGDKILSMVIASWLYKKFPNSSEGDLSIMHSNLVNSDVLSYIAKEIGLGEFLILGKSEKQNNGRDNKNNLADAMEALIAAIYIDSDINIAKDFVLDLWQNFLNDENGTLAKQDPKSHLQEISQKIYKLTPKYIVESITGREHNPKFTIKVFVNQNLFAFGSGNNKKTAEIDAATKLINIIKNGK